MPQVTPTAVVLRLKLDPLPQLRVGLFADFFYPPRIYIACLSACRVGKPEVEYQWCYCDLDNGTLWISTLVVVERRTPGGQLVFESREEFADVGS